MWYHVLHVHVSCKMVSLWNAGPATKLTMAATHDEVIKWKRFPRYWPFVRGIYRSPVNSPHKGQWREALMFSLICLWIISWVNNREAGDLRRYRAHYDVIVMQCGAADVTVDEPDNDKIEWYPDPKSAFGLVRIYKRSAHLMIIFLRKHIKQ